MKYKITKIDIKIKENQPTLNTVKTAVVFKSSYVLIAVDH